MPNTDYDYMLYAIKDYYGTHGGGGIWNKIELGLATPQEISFAFSQIPQRTLSIDRTASGYTLGYGYADPIYMEKYKNPILDSIDSNYETGQYSDVNSFTPRINSTWEYDSADFCSFYSAFRSSFRKWWQIHIFVLVFQIAFNKQIIIKVTKK